MFNLDSVTSVLCNETCLESRLIFDEVCTHFVNSHFGFNYTSVYHLRENFFGLTNWWFATDSGNCGITGVSSVKLIVVSSSTGELVYYPFTYIGGGRCATKLSHNSSDYSLLYFEVKNYGHDFKLKRDFPPVFTQTGLNKVVFLKPKSFSVQLMTEFRKDNRCLRFPKSFKDSKGTDWWLVHTTNICNVLDYTGIYTIGEVLTFNSYLRENTTYYIGKSTCNEFPGASSCMDETSFVVFDPLSKIRYNRVVDPANEQATSSWSLFMMFALILSVGLILDRFFQKKTHKINGSNQSQAGKETLF